MSLVSHLANHLSEHVPLRRLTVLREERDERNLVKREVNV